MLEKGILKYSKTQQDVREKTRLTLSLLFLIAQMVNEVSEMRFMFVFQIQRGKLHGSLDVSLAVMSINKKSRRIDLDAGDNLYHLMVSTGH